MKPHRLSTTALGIILLVWMGVIFAFSSFPGSPFSLNPPVWYFVERKGAHVFEYALLLLLAYNYFSRIFVKEKESRIFLFVIVFSLTYAMTDELHQFFVPFRGAKFSDVLIDGGGIFSMSLLLHLFSLRKKI